MLAGTKTVRWPALTETPIAAIPGIDLSAYHWGKLGGGHSGKKQPQLQPPGRKKQKVQPTSQLPPSSRTLLPGAGGDGSGSGSVVESTLTCSQLLSGWQVAAIPNYAATCLVSWAAGRRRVIVTCSRPTVRAQLAQQVLASSNTRPLCHKSCAIGIAAAVLLGHRLLAHSIKLCLKWMELYLLAPCVKGPRRKDRYGLWVWLLRRAWLTILPPGSFRVAALRAQTGAGYACIDFAMCLQSPHFFLYFGRRPMFCVLRSTAWLAWI